MSTSAVTPQPDAPQQMTPQEFAGKVRAKYPGAYDSLPDEELTQKVVAKHPEYGGVVQQSQAKPMSASERTPGGGTSMPGSFEGHPENIGEYVPASVGQVASGVGNLAHGNLAVGGHQVISGLGNAALPVAPFVAAAAPLSMARGIVGGLAGGKLAKAGAEGVGANPDQQQLSEDVGNIAGGGLASRSPAPLIRGVARAGNAMLDKAPQIGMGVGLAAGAAEAAGGRPSGLLYMPYLGNRLGTMAKRFGPIPGENFGVQPPAPSVPAGDFSFKANAQGPVAPPENLPSQIVRSIEKPRIPTSTAEAPLTNDRVAPPSSPVGNTTSTRPEAGVGTPKSAPEQSVARPIGAGDTSTDLAKALGFKTVGQAIQRFGPEKWNEISAPNSSTADVGPIGKPTPFNTQEFRSRDIRSPLRKVAERSDFLDDQATRQEIEQREGSNAETPERPINYADNTESLIAKANEHKIPTSRFGQAAHTEAVKENIENTKVDEPKSVLVKKVTIAEPEGKTIQETAQRAKKGKGVQTSR